MTLSAATKSFESVFKHVRYGTEDTKSLYQCSGGEIKSDGIQPALYATEELAVEAWGAMAKTWLESRIDIFEDQGQTLEWGLQPELLDFQMTMADRHGAHRLVTKRYAVRSQMRMK